MSMFGFGDIPEEVREKYEEHMRQHEAMITDYQHKLQGIWDSMSTDDLVEFATWLTRLSDMNERSLRTLLAFTGGALTTQASQRKNVCRVCGVDHDENFQEGLQQILKDVPTHSSDPVNTTQPPTPVAEQEDSLVVDSNALIAEWEADVKKYGLVQDFENGGFNCARCRDWHYSSLDDRKLKPSDRGGCPGCVNKAKNGGTFYAD